MKVVYEQELRPPGSGIAGLRHQCPSVHAQRFVVVVSPVPSCRFAGTLNSNFKKKRPSVRREKQGQRRRLPSSSFLFLRTPHLCTFVQKQECLLPSSAKMACQILHSSQRYLLCTPKIKFRNECLSESPAHFLLFFQ
jgi:hypothetical protein